MPCYVIRRIQVTHCKRGPDRCEQCRQMNAERICLLDVCPPHPGEVQRRVTQVTVAGRPAWREYDVVRSFEDEAEARQYAASEGIEDVEL